MRRPDPVPRNLVVLELSVLVFRDHDVSMARQLVATCAALLQAIFALLLFRKFADPKLLCLFRGEQAACVVDQAVEICDGLRRFRANGFKQEK